MHTPRGDRQGDVGTVPFLNNDDDDVPRTFRVMVSAATGGREGSVHREDTMDKEACGSSFVR